jgi:hypothetical protein
VNVSEDILLAFKHCVDRADRAGHPEEWAKFLLLAEEFQRIAAKDATKLALEMPKRPAVPLVRRPVLRRAVG